MSINKTVTNAMHYNHSGTDVFSISSQYRGRLLSARYYLICLKTNIVGFFYSRFMRGDFVQKDI